MNYELRIKDKKKVKLYIDTTDRYKTIIELSLNYETFKVEKKSKSHKDQFVLALILELLRKNKLSIYDISDIDVNPGPGSFTGIRVGMSIAQALKYALKLSKKSVEPNYSV